MTSDEVPELLVVRRGSAELAVYVRQPNMGYALGGVFMLPLNPLALAVGHIDGDGVPDIAIAAGGANVVAVLMSFP